MLLERANAVRDMLLERFRTFGERDTNLGRKGRVGRRGREGERERENGGVFVGVFFQIRLIIVSDQACQWPIWNLSGRAFENFTKKTKPRTSIQS